VLGVDRTFNLGEMFLTTIVCKHPAIVRSSTNENPIFLGPMYIHGRSLFEDYHSFFSHVKTKLNNTKNLVLGSDDEKALTKAMRYCFPTATHLLCTRHLKGNLNDFMKDKAGLTQSERVKISEKVFGDEGVINANDSVTFAERVKGVEAIYVNDRLQKYMEKRLYPSIHDYVLEPAWRHLSSTSWTNNNAESLNHVLKLSTQWKLQTMPDLISKLGDLVQLQHKEVA